MLLNIRCFGRIEAAHAGDVGIPVRPARNIGQDGTDGADRHIHLAGGNHGGLHRVTMYRFARGHKQIGIDTLVP